jgi:ElaB/YqjD/DUF883 family membrane-anchored ribosome-binding protein
VTAQREPSPPSAVQRKINQTNEAHDQVETFIRENPITAMLIAVGIGTFSARLFEAKGLIIL